MRTEGRDVHIVVGVTARRESRAALERAIAEAELRGARLHIVRTMADVVSGNPVKARRWADDLVDARDEGAQLVEQLADRGIDATHRVEGDRSDAAAVLLELAQEVGADLIVIGIRRRSAVGKLVLGSVSQNVVLGADCPVLVVKASVEPES